MIPDINWGGAGYGEYGGECKSGPGAAERQAQTNTAQDRMERAKQQAQFDSDVAPLEKGKIQDTEYYKDQLGRGTEDTSLAYDQVRSNRSAKARMAGFGYEQPLTQGDASSIDALEAHDIGDMPRQIASEVQDRRDQIAQTRAGLVGTYSGSANSNMSTWANAEEARKARQAAMWGKIAGLGMTAATTFIPH